MDPTFDFERLEVYQLSRELNREVAALLKDLPRGAGESADNLRRAARSITRNIAEACGKWTLPDKINRFQIARGSASECGAALNELVDYGFTSPDRVARARTLTWRVVSSLIGLIRSLQREPPRPKLGNRPKPGMSE